MQVTDFLLKESTISFTYLRLKSLKIEWKPLFFAKLERNARKSVLYASYSTNFAVLLGFREKFKNFLLFYAFVSLFFEKREVLQPGSQKVQLFMKHFINK